VIRSHVGPPMGRASIGTAVILMALGATLAFAVDAPAEVEGYVDVLDLGLILVWSGILILLMQVVMHRRPGPRGRSRRDDHADGYDRHDRSDIDNPGAATGNDVHRPGYAGETQRFPTVRGDGRR